MTGRLNPNEASEGPPVHGLSWFVATTEWPQAGAEAVSSWFEWCLVGGKKRAAAKIMA